MKRTLHSVSRPPSTTYATLDFSMTKADDAPPVVLITGAASGVGRAAAVRFADEGYDVVVSFPNPDEAAAEATLRLIEDRGRRGLLCECDVSKDHEVVEMLARVNAEVGRLDVVINCAGVTHFIDHADLDDMTAEKWEQILGVNTMGPFFVTRSAAPLLREGGAGAVVNVSSVAGVSGQGSCLAYCASKGALNTMTKSLARALAPEIRVNAVCPGPIDSGWLRRGIGEEKMSKRVQNFPIARLAQPEDIVDALFYLAAGTSMTTGQLLIVDGGRTM